MSLLPDGVMLTLDALGDSATSDLTTGHHDVSGNHLSLSAGPAEGGQAVGSGGAEDPLRG